MPKIITSPVPEFPGTITLCNPLTLAQCVMVEIGFGNIGSPDAEKKVWVSPRDQDALAALLACSEHWDIKGQPERPTLETFIATPRIPTHRLIIWAFRELKDIYFGELAVPNA
jgi:hypothetical protein